MQNQQRAMYLTHASKSHLMLFKAYKAGVLQGFSPKQSKKSCHFKCRDSFFQQEMPLMTSLDRNAN